MRRKYADYFNQHYCDFDLNGYIIDNCYGYNRYENSIQHGDECYSFEELLSELTKGKVSILSDWIKGPYDIDLPCIYGSYTVGKFGLALYTNNTGSILDSSLENTILHVLDIPSDTFIYSNINLLNQCKYYKYFKNINEPY